MRSDGDGSEGFGELLSGDGDAVGECLGCESWVLDGCFLAELADVRRGGLGEAEP